MGVVAHYNSQAIQVVTGPHLLGAVQVRIDRASVENAVIELRTRVVHALHRRCERDIGHGPAGLLLRRIAKCRAQTKNAGGRFPATFFLDRIAGCPVPTDTPPPPSPTILPHTPTHPLPP